MIWDCLVNTSIEESPILIKQSDWCKQLFISDTIVLYDDSESLFKLVNAQIYVELKDC